MVCQNAHGYVGLLLNAILLATEAADDADDWLEDISIVVRGLTLEGANEALEAHAGINDVSWQLLQTAIGHAVILHEDDVPDLDDLWMILVDELTTALSSLLFVRTRVIMDL